MAKQKWSRKSTGSAKDAADRAESAGLELPFIDGSPKPQMRTPKSPQMVDDRLNVHWFVEMRAIYIEFNSAWFNYYGEPWPDFDQSMENLNRMAGHSGLDLSAYAPERLTIHDLKTTDDLFSLTANQIDRILHQIEHSHEYGLEILDDVKKKHWVAVMQSLRHLHHLCSTAIPQGRDRTAAESETWECLFPIRFGLWCERSTTLSDDGEADLLDIPEHWVWMCLASRLARKYKAVYDIKGVVIVIPPGHGKSVFAVIDEALLICQHPQEPSAVIHNSAKIAKERLQHIQSYFDPANDRCQRRSALFPEITGEKDGPWAEKFFVKVNGKRVNIHEEGNMNCFGLHSRAQGKSLMRALFDDPSDEKEQTEAGTRERSVKAFENTWMQRLRGNSAFFTLICTRWHPSDISGKLLSLIRQGVMDLGYLSIACGGEYDDFEPIWPKMCGRAKLKREFFRLGPGDYACVYQNNPDAESKRRIAKLHHYDYDLWRKPMERSDAWKEFLDSPETRFHISADPSGTEHRDSNLAGITYSACGHLKINGEYKVVLVFLEKWSMLADQARLASTIFDIYQSRRVDQITIETTGGYHATVSSLVHEYGIKASKVIGRPPGQGSKVARLMKYAMHLQNGAVLFPGQWATEDSGDERLEIHRDWEDMAEQILRAGTTKESNLLDCVRQQLSIVASLLSYDTGVSDDSGVRQNDDRSLMHGFYKKNVTKAKTPPRSHLQRYGRFLKGAMA